MFVVAYPRETQEMAFGVLTRAFAYFGGMPRAHGLDNLGAHRGSDLHGKDRQFNRRLHGAGGDHLFAHALHAGVGVGEGAGE